MMLLRGTPGGSGDGVGENLKFCINCFEFLTADVVAFVWRILGDFCWLFYWVGFHTICDGVLHTICDGGFIQLDLDHI
ncbi:hypothetical protein Hanom_Chr07g00616901 [Helianthus anomalus]